MKYLTLILTIILSLSSCNIKEAKNHDTTTVTQQSTTDSDINTNTAKELNNDETYQQLDSEQIERDSFWSDSMNNDLEMEDRLIAMDNFFNSFNESLNENSSHYTVLVLKNEFFKKLEFFEEKIKRIKKISITKNYINTKMGKLKDLYIHFTKRASSNTFLYKTLLDEDFLKKTNKNVTNHFLRNIAEIKLFEGLNLNDGFNLEEMSKEDIVFSLYQLEQAAQIKNELKAKNFKFILNKQVKNKLNLIRIGDFQLDTNQDALQIQKYIDLFLN